MTPAIAQPAAWTRPAAESPPAAVVSVAAPELVASAEPVVVREPVGAEAVLLEPTVEVDEPETMTVWEATVLVTVSVAEAEAEAESEATGMVSMLEAETVAVVAAAEPEAPPALLQRPVARRRVSARVVRGVVRHQTFTQECLNVPATWVSEHWELARQGWTEAWMLSNWEQMQVKSLMEQSALLMPWDRQFRAQEGIWLMMLVTSWARARATRRAAAAAYFIVTVGREAKAFVGEACGFELEMGFKLR